MTDTRSSRALLAVTKHLLPQPCDSSSKVVVETGTPWEQRCGCARAVRIGETVHVSGTCAQGETPTAQVNAIMKVIGEAVQKAGGRGLEDVSIARMISANVSEEFGELGDAMNKVFEGTGNKPSNTLFGGSLLQPWMKVEIEATADIGAKSLVQTGTAWEQRCGCARATRVGNTIHVSGTCAQGDTPTAQVNAIMKVIADAVKGAGGRGLEDIVMLRMISANVSSDWRELGDAVKNVFNTTGNVPCNTLFGGKLLQPWMKVEVEATAVVESSSKAAVHAGFPWEKIAGCARAVRVGNTIHVSGTCARGDTPTAQVQGIMKVIKDAVQKAGGRGLEDITIVRMISANVSEDFGELGDAINKVFEGTGNKPSNTLFGGSLLQPDKVEIEVTAIVQA